MAKKKVKKRRVNKKNLIVFLLVMVFVSCGMYNIFTKKIDAVIVVGTNFLKDDDVVKLSKITSDTSYYFNTTYAIKKDLLKSEFIKDVSVKKHSNGNVTINIVENNILFYNSISNEYILEGGVGITYNGVLFGVPTLITDVPSDVLNDFAEQLALIDVSLLSKISEIIYSPSISEGVVLDDCRFMFKMNDMNTVYVNVINLSKFSKYEDIIEVQNKKGTLYLDSNNTGHIFDIYE